MFRLMEHTRKMKPCDCKMEVGVKQLREQGLAFNNYKIEVDSSGVYLDIDPHVRMKIPHNRFKAFAEWYLLDQGMGRQVSKQRDTMYKEYGGGTTTEANTW